VTCRQEVSPSDHVPIQAKNGAIPKKVNEPFQSAAPLTLDEAISDGVGLGLELVLELELERELVELRPVKPIELEPEPSGRPSPRSSLELSLPLPGVLVDRGLVEVKVSLGYVEVRVMV